MSLNHAQLAQQARELKARGKFDDAIALYAEVARLDPGSAVAEHNLAAALGDAGRHRACESHIRQAFALGGDAGETWLVLARALVGLKRFQEAEQAFREAISRKFTLYDAHRELAQLHWMMSGDVAAALADLEIAERLNPADVRIQVVKSQVLEMAGEKAMAHELNSALARAYPDDPTLCVLAAQSAQATGNPNRALVFAERALRLAPGHGATNTTLAECCLAAGQAQRAAAISLAALQQTPDNQHLIAMLATAWRLLGDPRYHDLFDYEALVRPMWLDPPPGWRDLDHYVCDLKQALSEEHGFLAHPFGQSVRFGTQATDILQRDHPALRALPQALDGPINAYLKALGSGDDPIRRRNYGRYQFHGMWSIRMRAGGFHIDHVHAQGWISSACYVSLPAAPNGKEGWIKFGQPGIRTMPPLEAEHFVEPALGRLVLFPSYMWHGTVPFTDDGVRMTFAFDLLPI